MADVAEDNKVVEATPADEVKETVKEVVKDTKEKEEAPAAEAETAPADAPAAETKDKEGENGTAEAPKENGNNTEENGTANGNSEVDSEDAERKRKSDVVTGDETDGATTEGVAEKKAKLEEKSEEVAAEAPSNGEPGVVA